MDLSHIDGRYIEVLREIIASPGIRQAAIVGSKGEVKIWKLKRIALLVEDGLVSYTDTPHRGRHGYVREYTATPYGLSVAAKIDELEAIQP